MKSTKMHISKEISLKDPLVCERCKKMPDLGPKILFFSGGSSLKDTCRFLINYTHNSIHIVTPFDSGGSSSKIRKEFGIMSVGDMRNRLMSLSNHSVKAKGSIHDLFSYRLPENARNTDLKMILVSMSEGNHALFDKIKNPMKQIISNHIKTFVHKASNKFDYRGANIGNIVITGGYLSNGQNIDAVLYTFTKLVGVKGVVKTVVQDSLDLVAVLENHSIVYGQHLITGKETPPIKSPVSKLFLSNDSVSFQPSDVKIKQDVLSLIKKAHIICYPFGSFYTSLIANFLPTNIGKYITNNPNPKIYVPNTYFDPEQIGLSLYDQVRIMLKYLKTPCEYASKALNFILLDTDGVAYPYKIDKKEIENLGIRILETRLVSYESRPKVDPKIFVKTLISMT